MLDTIYHYRRCLKWQKSQTVLFHMCLYRAWKTRLRTLETILRSHIKSSPIGNCDVGSSPTKHTMRQSPQTEIDINAKCLICRKNQFYIRASKNGTCLCQLRGKVTVRYTNLVLVQPQPASTNMHRNFQRNNWVITSSVHQTKGM